MKTILSLFLLAVTSLCVYMRPEISLQYISELKWPVVVLFLLISFKKEIKSFLIDQVSSLSIKAFGAEIKMKIKNQTEESKNIREIDQHSIQSVDSSKSSFSECEKELEFERIYNRLLELQFMLLESLLSKDRELLLDVYQWYDKYQKRIPALKNFDINNFLNYLYVKKLITVKNPDSLLCQKIGLTENGKKFVEYINKHYKTSSE